MAKTIVVCGYGPGISRAMAEKFGREGFAVALVARGADKVQAAAAALKQAGVSAAGFACDLADPAAVAALIPQVRSALGPIGVLHWNAYSHAAGDLLSAEPSALRHVFDVSITSLIVAVQQSLPDLQQAETPAVLVTGGALSTYGSAADERAAQFGAMGLALAKAAQHKTSGLLHHKLKPLGIYVGEVTVSAIVKGTAADRGYGTLEASAVAERFWQLYRAREDVYSVIP